VNIKQVKVYSPGSIANIGPGFDVFGLAIDGLGDHIKLSILDEPEVIIKITGIDSDRIPTVPSRNSSGAVLEYICNKQDLKHGFLVNIHKGIPPGKGMGSSGASAAGTAFAVNKILNLNLNQDDLVRLAAIGESAVAGSAHADNVSSSLLGGFVMVDECFNVVRLDAPNIEIVVVAPELYIENKTKIARELLPEQISLKDAVYNIGKASRIAVAVAINDPELFGKSISDHVIEPHRARMIPHFWSVKKAALEAGAYGCSIAGGGPSMFAVGQDLFSIGKAMMEAFQEIDSKPYYTRPSNLGVRLI
jgi:homoserine kinase